MAVLTLIATCLGIFLSILNLIVFLREKDRSYLKLALSVVFLGGALVTCLTLPGFAPDLARRFARQLPDHHLVRLWLSQAGSGEHPPDASPLRGSFTPELQHNLFGGISGLKLKFRFVSLHSVRARVLGYRLRIEPERGQAELSYERLLSEPLVVEPHETGLVEVEVDREILEAYFRRMDAANPGRISITWQGADERGQSFDFSAEGGTT
ncbi:MAG: hypothetical protein AMXMBFR33_13570 [Candidatus Xenobia bacterium]|jgi:hypothetical protein